MPNYEFIDPESGRRVIRRLPVAERDSFPGRVTVPSRINVCPKGEPETGSQLLDGWKACEQSMGTEGVRKMARGLGLSREQVKQACLAPDSVMERPVAGEVVAAG